MKDYHIKCFHMFIFFSETISLHTVFRSLGFERCEIKLWIILGQYNVLKLFIIKMTTYNILLPNVLEEKQSNSNRVKESMEWTS